MNKKKTVTGIRKAKSLSNYDICILNIKQKSATIVRSFIRSFVRSLVRLFAACFLVVLFSWLVLQTLFQKLGCVDGFFLLGTCILAKYFSDL